MKKWNLYHKKFMLEALSDAAGAQAEVPVAAIIVNNTGEIVSKAINSTIYSCDPTAHAEIVAIRKACKQEESSYLNDCAMYVTLEPCAMCAAAISYARIKNVFFSAYDLKFGAIESNFQVYGPYSRLYKPQYMGGLEEDRGRRIISSFFKDKRN